MGWAEDGQGINQDSQGPADFIAADTAFYCATTANEVLIRRCSEGIRLGLRPIIITQADEASAIKGVADHAGIGDQVDVYDGVEFLSGSILRYCMFNRVGLADRVADVVGSYDRLVAEIGGRRRFQINVVA